MSTEKEKCRLRHFASCEVPWAAVKVQTLNKLFGCQPLNGIARFSIVMFFCSNYFNTFLCWYLNAIRLIKVNYVHIYVLTLWWCSINNPGLPIQAYPTHNLLNFIVYPLIIWLKKITFWLKTQCVRAINTLIGLLFVTKEKFWVNSLLLLFFKQLCVNHKNNMWIQDNCKLFWLN